MRTKLSVLVLVLLLPASIALAEPEISVSAPTSLGGLPLEIEVTLIDSGARPATVFLDGREIGTHNLVPGANPLRYKDEKPAAGDHLVVVTSGSLATEAQLRLIPGWLSILPPLIAIGLALITKDVLISLFLGIFGGGLILFDWNPVVAFAHAIDRYIAPALANPAQASILIFTIMLGGMVGLVTKNGGTHGIVERLKPYATSQRRGQLATWALGVLVFFDDYANTLIVGPTMRPITDRLKISREKLAYIVDSTAAPVVCLFPISTWVGFEIGLIGTAFTEIGLANDPYTTFVATIPYRFYPIFALVLVATLAITRFDFGPMRKAEARARDQGLVLAEDAAPIADYGSHEVEPPAHIPKRAFNAILPILTVIGITVLGLYLTGTAGLAEGDEATVRSILANADSSRALLWASLTGMLVALLLPLIQKLLSIREAMGAMMGGFKAMFMALVVLVLAWALAAVCAELHTADFLVALASDSVSPAWLPALVFVLSAATAFATGSSWGTMGILEPLVIPICHSLSLAAGHQIGDDTYMLYMLASIASVLAGSIWGDHCSPISDTTILSSMATGCDHIAHVRTQLPYALSIGLLGILVGSIPAAFGLSVWISLAAGILLVVGGVIGLGKWTAQRA
ncbi:MAG: Na+/H+ antiporter NhaC family protein [bacterium]|nr:Na+/H+ antiporter NhaC family protein [bacterium]